MYNKEHLKLLRNTAAETLIELTKELDLADLIGLIRNLKTPNTKAEKRLIRFAVKAYKISAVIGAVSARDEMNKPPKAQ